jgi:hypothetical protein
MQRQKGCLARRELSDLISANSSTDFPVDSWIASQLDAERHLQSLELQSPR